MKFLTVLFAYVVLAGKPPENPYLDSLSLFIFDKYRNVTVLEKIDRRIDQLLDAPENCTSEALIENYELLIKYMKLAIRFWRDPDLPFWEEYVRHAAIKIYTVGPIFMVTDYESMEDDFKTVYKFKDQEVKKILDIHEKARDVWFELRRVCLYAQEEPFVKK